MDYNERRVIFVTGSLANGGAEKVISVLANACAAVGANVTLVVLRNQKNIYLINNQVKIIQFNDIGRTAIFTRIKKLHRLLKESNADVVIPFLPIITLYTMIANIGIGKKIIMSERADPHINLFKLGWKDRIGSFMMRTVGLFNKADWMVFQTPDAQSFYSKELQEKSSIIPNPLDLASLPERYNGEREKRIVASGRFSMEKNFPMLLNGFAEFHKSHPEYSLTLYGEGELRNEFEKQIVELGIKDYVDMPGFTADLPMVIRKAAIYVSTSNHEGISNSMLEALGMGIPTIVTDCPIGGAKAFVHTDENGILIPMNNEIDLVNAMKMIVEDPQYSVMISKNAEKIRDKLSSVTICKQWLDLICKIN